MFTGSGKSMIEGVSFLGLYKIIQVRRQHEPYIITEVSRIFWRKRDNFAKICMNCFKPHMHFFVWLIPCRQERHLVSARPLWWLLPIGLLTRFLKCSPFVCASWQKETFRRLDPNPELWLMWAGIMYWEESCMSPLVHCAGNTSVKTEKVFILVRWERERKNSVSCFFVSILKFVYVLSVLVFQICSHIC